MRQIEDKLQEAVHQFLLLALRKPSYHFAVPNGGRRHQGTAKKLKAQGIRAGVADIVIINSEGKAFFLELKRPKTPTSPKGQLSTNQKMFAKEINKCSAPYAVAHSIDEVQALLKDWKLL